MLCAGTEYRERREKCPVLSVCALKYFKLVEIAREPELALDFLREQVGRGNYVYTAACGEEPVG